MMNNYNPFSLEGRVILITGASSGIGQATAIECSKLGAVVILTGRNEERLKQTILMLEGKGHSYRICELSNTNDINSLVDSLPELDGFVNNAGTNKISPIQFYKEDVVREIIDVNTITPILLLKQLVKKKKIKKNSSIVYTSSLAGLGAGATGNGVYTASKGAISAFIKVAAMELSTKGIRVNAVCPGMTKTPMIHDEAVQEEQLAADMERYPLKRYGEPKEIALGIIYLLSEASSWTTGINLVIDGGLTTY